MGFAVWPAAGYQLKAGELQPAHGVAVAVKRYICDLAAGYAGDVRITAAPIRKRQFVWLSVLVASMRSRNLSRSVKKNCFMMEASS